MKFFSRFQKLLFTLIAIIGISVAASHLCSVFSHAPSHHEQNQTIPTPVAYSTEFTYEQCCVNKEHSEQLTTAIPKIQKYIAGIQVVLVNTFNAPISTAYASSNLQSFVQSDKPDPGGGLVLRC